MKFLHMDADESVFFIRELTAVKTKSYDVVYPELQARSLIPVSSEAGPGAEAIRYEQYDMVGMAKVISAYGSDLPRADIKGKEFLSSIKSLGASYGYNLQEIRAAKFANKPLQQRKANAAKRAILQTENQIAWNGDSTNNLPGLLSNNNVSVVVLAADGAANSTTWASKTPDQVLRDMNQLVNFIPESTNMVEQPDTLLLPVKQLNHIATTRLGASNDRTILEFFKSTNPYIKNIVAVNEIKGAGAGGLDMMMAYSRNPDKLTLEIPQDFEQLDVEQRNLEFVIPCHSRCGGVLVYYPMSIAKAIGI